eukprot:gene24424-30768_t
MPDLLLLQTQRSQMMRNEPDSESAQVDESEYVIQGDAEQGLSESVDKTDGEVDATSSEPALSEEEQQEMQNRLQDEKDTLRMTQLKETESALRAQSAQYMGVFDSFQSRLSQSNTVFAQKQATIEQLTKEIRLLEKENKQYTAKLSQLSVSNRGYVIGNERLLKERERVSKASDKYAELIATFQSDIADMERRV